jgi:hypothetical protein
MFAQKMSLLLWYDFNGNFKGIATKNLLGQAELKTYRI